MRFSFAVLPGHRAEETLWSIERADELGLHACYTTDGTGSNGLSPLLAAAARRTRRIRLGSTVTARALREPELVAQAAAALDELSGGRAELVLSCGDA
ncbi:MAG TPA: LLM class flavin-dependent oxidoreductase, partial [Pseudonocardia sp.]|nr:LLM class flavin-dependent oxidoreductase [Pseudonocardia sp.]